MPRRLTVAISVSLLLCAALSQAYAQDTGLSDPVAPWLENKTYPDEYKSPYLRNEEQEKARMIPRSGEHTEQLPAGLYDKNGKKISPQKETGARRAEEVPPSALETLYSERAGEPLQQFGYDLFGREPENGRSGTENLPPLGAVQDNFILGIGDELLVTFSGQRTDQETYRINGEGTILIKDLPPVPAAGRTIGEVREVLKNEVSSLPNTQAYISLASVRQVGILVVGHVENPGRRNLTVFHTVLDALSAGGGIRKTGSLRKIKLVRQGRSRQIDLYDLLLHGGIMTDMRLQDGDRIIVPPIGPTVAVAGDVNRPGIYEIRTSLLNRDKGSESLSLDDMLTLAGGILVPGQNRFILLDLDQNGRENVTEIENSKKQQFSHGAILNVLKSREKRAGTVELSGHTRKPGLQDLNRNRTLSALLDTPDVLDEEIYPLIGVIERWDPEELSKKYLEFSVRSVLNRTEDQNLQDGDHILLFSKSEISELEKDDTARNSEIEKAAYPQSGLSSPPGSSLNDPALRSYLKEHGVTVQGAIRSPGTYPVSEGVTLDHLIAVAGGLTIDADRSDLEITGAFSVREDSPVPSRQDFDLDRIPPENIPVHPGDSIRIKEISRKTEERTVMIRGEVRNPGPYDILPGDRLSDLIERAGGLTAQAYPEGAVFSRESQRKAEKARFRAVAQDMKRALASSMQQDKDPPDAGQIRMARELAEELESVEPLGRMTVESDPDVLAVKPELDILLETGDRLFIPKRPLTVRVDGEVLSPASLQFRKDKDPGDYIREAGGFTYHADKDRAFVIYPDGSAQPLKVSLWNHNAVMIPPGSTIVVPRDPKPFDFIQSARDVSQILSNLAITSIFIDDIRN